MINILTFKADNEPEQRFFCKEYQLEEMQKFVGGYIEAINLKPPYILICNEEGKLRRLPYQSKYNIYGDFLVSKTDNSGGEFVSLNVKDIEIINKFFK